jgi:hypothetical protein
MGRREARMPQPKKYPKPLDTPEPRPKEDRRAYREWMIRRVRMYRTLMTHHGISSEASELDQWIGLAQALARVHVPYFKVRNVSGSKTVWVPHILADLKVAVEQAKQEAPDTSVTRICLGLASVDPWQSLLASSRSGWKKPKPGLALKAHYEEANRQAKAAAKE